MVSLFFGLPGSGKTTIMAYLASKYVKSKRYNSVYSNVRLSIDGVTYIDNDCIGKYNLTNCLLLIDEATLFADNRAYKEFSKDKIEFFLLHRHYKCDIYLFTQQWDGVDRKIRVITDRVYYVYKPLLTGHWISKFYRIPYGIIIPDSKKDSNKLGEIIQGYCKPPFLVRLFATKIFRPKYYKYFDSFECKALPELPSIYKVYASDPKSKKRKKGKSRSAAVAAEVPHKTAAVVAPHDTAAVVAPHDTAAVVAPHETAAVQDQDRSSTELSIDILTISSSKLTPLDLLKAN